MSEPAVEEPIKAPRHDAGSMGDLEAMGAPDRFAARPKTEPSLADSSIESMGAPDRFAAHPERSFGSKVMSGLAHLGGTAAGIKTGSEGSALHGAQSAMEVANAMPVKAGLNHMMSSAGAPIVDMAHHGGVALKAASHLAQKISGHDASEVAHTARAETAESFKELDATKNAWAAQRAAKAAGQVPVEAPKKAVDDLTPEEREARIAEITRRNFGRNLKGNALKSPTAQMWAAAKNTTLKLQAQGKEVQDEGYHAPTELTHSETAMMNGYTAKRNAKGDLVNTPDPDGVPKSTVAGKLAQVANAPLQLLHGAGGAIAGDNGDEALRRGDFGEAIARSTAGGAAAVGKQAAATAADAHGAGGLGGLLVTGASMAAGTAVKGLASGIGSVTGVSRLAERQRIAEKSENYFGADGTRRAELLKGGINPRPAPDGLNDEAAGMPSTDFAGEGESYAEGSAAADKSLKESGWGERGVWSSMKSGFHRGVRWGDKNLSSKHSVLGTIARGGSGLIAGAGHGLAAMGSKIVRHVGKFAGGVGGAAKGAWSNIKGHVGKFASGVWDKAASGASWIGNKIGGAMDWLKGKILNSQHHDRSGAQEEALEP